MINENIYEVDKYPGGFGTGVGPGEFVWGNSRGWMYLSGGICPRTPQAIDAYGACIVKGNGGLGSTLETSTKFRIASNEIRQSYLVGGCISVRKIEYIVLITGS